MDVDRAQMRTLLIEQSNLFLVWTEPLAAVAVERRTSSLPTLRPRGSQLLAKLQSLPFRQPGGPMEPQRPGLWLVPAETAGLFVLRME